ncbi:hypothetical protein IAF10_19540, partial [Acinetobacter baumannii]|nr:hypothetical protein [Acinetobacter baumannii]
IILSLVAAVFLIRGFAFPWLKSKFVGNSDLFWYVSSAFCLIFGESVTQMLDKLFPSNRS